MLTTISPISFKAKITFSPKPTQSEPQFPNIISKKTKASLGAWLFRTFIQRFGKFTPQIKKPS